MSELELKRLTTQELEDMITHHDLLYWKDNKPEISDEEYDSFTRELKRRAWDHPLLNKVHTPGVASLGKVRHWEPMLSLAKAYTIEEVMSWARSVARSPEEMFAVQPKYDGIAAKFTSTVDGKYVLSTRGNGWFGENITDKLPLINYEGIEPVDDLYKHHLVLGELLIRKDVFADTFSKIKTRDGSFYQNPRNAIAGIMGSKKIDYFLQQGVKVSLVDYRSHEYLLHLDQIEANWDKLVRELEQLPYPMDGIVVTLEDQKYKESLGATCHHPRGAIAFKFSTIRKTTVLRDVEWDIGKKKLTPVAVFDPLELGGVTVSRASLHNYQNVVDNDIRIGDTLTVERSGDVIPYILDSTPGEHRTPIELLQCPFCRQNIKQIGPDLVCMNSGCEGVQMRKLEAAMRQFDILYLGRSSLLALHQDLMVMNVADLFELTRSDLDNVSIWQDKSAERLWLQLQEKKSTLYDYQGIAALCIQGIGREIAKIICKKYDILKWNDNDPNFLSIIESIPTVGSVRAMRLYEGLIGQEGEIWSRLKKLIHFKSSYNPESKSLPTVCFTGKMKKPRSWYEQAARFNGLLPMDRVTASTDILVIPDVNHASSKVTTATSNGHTKVMTIDAWLATLSRVPF